MEAARTDLVLLVILGAGTDYTPGLPLTQMSSLWQHYIALRRTDPRFLTRSAPAATPTACALRQVERSPEGGGEEGAACTARGSTATACASPHF